MQGVGAQQVLSMQVLPLQAEAQLVLVLVLKFLEQLQALAVGQSAD